MVTLEWRGSQGPQERSATTVTLDGQLRKDNRGLVESPGPQELRGPQGPREKRGPMVCLDPQGNRVHLGPQELGAQLVPLGNQDF